MDALLLVALLGCGPGSGSDTGDTGAEGWADWSGEAVLVAVGSATVSDGDYSGTEVLSVLAERGDGPELCRLEYSLTATGTRDDCADCLWAYDLAVGDAVPSVEIGAGCVPADAVYQPLTGGVLPYGYASEYLGHSDVLLTVEDDRWKAVAYAAWDPDSGAFSYEWERGIVTVAEPGTDAAGE